MLTIQDIQTVFTNHTSNINPARKQLLNRVDEVVKSSVTKSLQFADDSTIKTQLSQRLTVADLQTAMSWSQAGSSLLVAYLNLEPVFNVFKNQFDMKDRLKNTPTEFLEPISLETFQKSCSQTLDSPVWYALSPNELFLKRQVIDLKQMEGAFELLSMRINWIAQKHLKELNAHASYAASAPGWIYNLNLMIGKLCSLNPQELTALSPHIPAVAFRLLLEDQIREINYDIFSSEQLRHLVLGDGVEAKQLKRILELNEKNKTVIISKIDQPPKVLFDSTFVDSLTTAQFFLLLKRFYTNMDLKVQIDYFNSRLTKLSVSEFEVYLDTLPDHLIQYIPEHYFEQFQFNQLPEVALTKLFVKEHYLTVQKLETNCKKIPLNAVQTVVNCNESLIRYLTPEQCHQLDVMQFSKETLQELFPSCTIETFHPQFKLSFIKDPQTGRYFRKYTGVEAGETKVYVYPEDALFQEIERRMKCSQSSIALFSKEQVKQLKLRLPTDIVNLLYLQYL